MKDEKFLWGRGLESGAIALFKQDYQPHAALLLPHLWHSGLYARHISNDSFQCNIFWLRVCGARKRPQQNIGLAESTCIGFRMTVSKGRID